MKCELCGAPAVHAETAGGKAHRWCGAHTPWGHLEFCKRCSAPVEVALLGQKLINPTVADLIAVLSALPPDLKVRLIDSDWGENALELVTLREDGVVLLHF